MWFELAMSVYLRGYCKPSLHVVNLKNGSNPPVVVSAIIALKSECCTNFKFALPSELLDNRRAKFQNNLRYNMIMYLS